MAAGRLQPTIYNRSFIYIQRFSFFQCNPLRDYVHLTIILSYLGQLSGSGRVRIRTIRQYHQIVEPVTVKLHRHFFAFSPLRQSKLNRVVPTLTGVIPYILTNFHTLPKLFSFCTLILDRCVKVMRKVHKNSIVSLSLFELFQSFQIEP